MVGNFIEIGEARYPTYSLRNAELSMAHQKPGNLLQHRVVSLLDVESVRVGLLWKSKFVAGSLQF